MARPRLERRRHAPRLSAAVHPARAARHAPRRRAAIPSLRSFTRTRAPLRRLPRAAIQSLLAVRFPMMTPLEIPARLQLPLGSPAQGGRGVRLRRMCTGILDTQVSGR